MGCSVQIGGRDVPVEFSFGLEVDLTIWQKILDFKPFQDYCQNMDPRFEVRRICIQSIDMFRTTIGFLKLKADIVNEKGDFIPGITLLRGGSVAILIVLHCNDGQRYTVIVKQPRASVGNFALPEIAAGMLDGSGNFTGKAAEEIQQELGIYIQREELVDLTALTYCGLGYPGIYASPGGSDEFFRVMLYVGTVSQSELVRFGNRATGLAEEGESMVTEVIPLDHLWIKVPDAKSLAAFALYQMYFLKGRA